MPTSRSKLEQIKLPINWLSEGRLKSSLLLRHSPITSDKTEIFFKLLSDDRVSRTLPSLNIKKSSEDGLRRASGDYLRCILAKSVANAYHKATARYRNEAARKQSFTTLLQLFEPCHLSDSPDPLTQLQSISDSDRVAVWVKSECDRLVQERVDIATEHAANLSTARIEFRKFLRELEEITGSSWQESERFSKFLSLSSVFPFGVVENESTWRWGTQWYPELGVLNINPPMLFLETVRKGLLAREAAVLLSPRIFDRMPEAPRPLCEQSEYLAYKLLERKNEKELWSQARHGLRRTTRVLGHDLIDFFEDYEMMVGESL